MPKEADSTPQVAGTQRSNDFRTRGWEPVIETPQSEDPDPKETFCLDNADGISTGREEGTGFSDKEHLLPRTTIYSGERDAMKLIHSTGRHCQHE